MDDKGQSKNQKSIAKPRDIGQFVLEKSIFSNIFDKDIRRVYIYKKAERLARGIHLVSPAFSQAPALKSRAGEIAIALVDAAVLPPVTAREALSRELLALSSLLSIARTASLLSPMNADLIAREAHVLLEEIASYEEPRVALEQAPTLAELSKSASIRRDSSAPKPRSASVTVEPKGQVQDGNRKEAILNVLKEKGASYIKDISTVVRDVSEKTIQRDLQSLVREGSVSREGNRRWTRYSLANRP